MKTRKSPTPNKNNGRGYYLSACLWSKKPGPEAGSAKPGVCSLLYAAQGDGSQENITRCAGTRQGKHRQKERERLSPHPQQRIFIEVRPCAARNVRDWKQRKAKGAEGRQWAARMGQLSCLLPGLLSFYLFDTSFIQSTHDPGNRNQTFTAPTQLHGIPKDLKASLRKYLN